MKKSRVVWFLITFGSDLFPWVSFFLIHTVDYMATVLVTVLTAMVLFTFQQREQIVGDVAFNTQHNERSGDMRIAHTHIDVEGCETRGLHTHTHTTGVEGSRDSRVAHTVHRC